MSLLETLGTRKEVLAQVPQHSLKWAGLVSSGCSGLGGHLTQWYLGGSSLLVVMNVMMARTEPTSVTSPQTGKTPWIWYSPSAHGREREGSEWLCRHHGGWGRIQLGLWYEVKSCPQKPPLP